MYKIMKHLEGKFIIGNIFKHFKQKTNKQTKTLGLCF